jgi:biotin-(acetyl-CoA carboxylase) ligase
MNDLAFHRQEQAKLDRRQSDRLMHLETWQEAEMKRATELREWLEEQRRERLSQIVALWRAQEAFANQRIAELKQRIEEIREQIPDG